MALGAAEGVLAASQSQPTSVPKRRPGKTGEMVSIIGFGLGSRFCSIQDENAAEALHRHDFDTVLIVLNAAQSANPIAQRKMAPIPAFEQSALPVALQKNMGFFP